MGFLIISPVLWRRSKEDRLILSPLVPQASNIYFSSSTLFDKSSLSETRFDDCALMMMMTVITMNSGRVSSIVQSDS